MLPVVQISIESLQSSLASLYQSNLSKRWTTTKLILCVGSATCSAAGCLAFYSVASFWQRLSRTKGITRSNSCMSQLTLTLQHLPASSTSLGVTPVIWILATPLSKFIPSISTVTYRRLRYRKQPYYKQTSISKFVHLKSKVKGTSISELTDIKGHKFRYRGSIS